MSNRDQRFVAVHRGGSLSKEHHSALASWAASCAEHVLHLFDAEHGEDGRVRAAICVARDWAAGSVTVGDGQKAALSAHAAARDSSSAAAVAAARSAGHAAAVAHMADHCLGAAAYALKAAGTTREALAAEFQWQVSQLPEGLKDLVVSALQARNTKLLAGIS